VFKRGTPDSASDNGLSAWSDCDILVDHRDRLLATAPDAIERQHPIVISSERTNSGVGETGSLDGRGLQLTGRPPAAYAQWELERARISALVSATPVPIIVAPFGAARSGPRSPSGSCLMPRPRHGLHSKAGSCIPLNGLPLPSSRHSKLGANRRQVTALSAPGQSVFSCHRSSI